MAALHYDNEILQMYYAPFPQEVEQRLLEPFRMRWPLEMPFDLDKVVPHPVKWPEGEDKEKLAEAVKRCKDEFEVDDAIAVFLLGGWK